MSAGRATWFALATATSHTCGTMTNSLPRQFDPSRLILCWSVVRQPLSKFVIKINGDQW